MGNYIKKETGITLIALVITIIVMLILVTVTIRISQNGSLFKHAANAVQETKKSAAEENALVDGNLSDKSIERIVAEQTAKISENGVIKEIVEEEGNLYYYENGEKQFDTGLILIDGDYYYVQETGELVRGTSYYAIKTNDLKPVGIYPFGDDGKMIITVAKNGIYEEEGTLFYYVNGTRTRSRINTNRW